MRRLVATALLLVGCAQTSAHRQPIVPEVGSKEEAETAPPGTWHPVIQGETLWRIAHHYGVSVNLLIKTNAIGDPTELQAGRRLFVPLAPGSDLDDRQRKVASRPKAIAPPSGPDQAPEGGFVAPFSGGRVIKTFGRRGDEVSDGINIEGAAGQPVVAVSAGRVVYAAEDPGWGHLVIIAHEREWVSIYAHNQARLVAEGDRVAQGDVIARLGATGRVATPQLHFELRRGVTPRNPALWLPPRSDLPRP